MPAGPATALRPIRDDDEPFLRRLYASTREQELAPLPWSEAEKRAFLDMQFDAQHRFYRDRFPAARFDVIECAGEPVGRLYVDRREGEIRVLDVALLPAWRNRGIGGGLLGALLEEARAGGRAVTLHVEPTNPANRLYRQLGFVEVADEGVYRLLRWHPGASAQAKTAS